jgi:hypothetical protein
MGGDPEWEEEKMKDAAELLGQQPWTRSLLEQNAPRNAIETEKIKEERRYFKETFKLSHTYQKNSNNIIPVLCAIKR